MPLFTKRADVLPANFVKSPNRGVGCYNDDIVLKFDRHLGSAATDVPVKFKTIGKVLTLISRLRDLRYCFNSSSPSVAYMRQWIGSTFVQIMACRLFGAKPWSKPCWVIVNWTLRNKLPGNFYQNAKLCIHEIVSEYIVCEMAAILSRGRCVKTSLCLVNRGLGDQVTKPQACE